MEPHIMEGMLLKLGTHDNSCVSSAVLKRMSHPHPIMDDSPELQVYQEVYTPPFPHNPPPQG